MKKYILILVLMFVGLQANSFKVSYDPDYAPFSYSIQNEPYGLLIDVWKEWSKKSGHNVTFIKANSWDEAIELAKDGKVDFFLGTDPYEKWMVASKPIYETKTSIFILRNFTKNISSIGIVGSDYKDDLKKKYKHAKIEIFDDYPQLVDALLKGKVDSIYDDSLAIDSFIFQKRKNHLIKKIDDYVVISEIDVISNSDKNIEIFNNFFKSIDKSTLKTIERNWVMNEKDIYYNEDGKSFLTDEEQKWIETHIVKVGVEPFAPIIFINNDKQIDGIAGDFTRRIIEKTGLHVELVPGEWQKILEDFKNGKLDLLPDTYKTKEREAFGLYSSGYFKMKDYIYISEKNSDIASMKDLSGKKLAIQKGNGNIAKIKEKFPLIELVQTKDVLDSIQRVLKNEVDALYAGQVIVEGKIKEDLIQGLKGIPQVAFKAPYQHFFSKKDEPLLHSIIEKGLKSISYKERQEIIAKWVSGGSSISFTNEELEFLDKEQSVRYVFDNNWKPFEWVNDLGEHDGIISDLLKIIEQKSGLRFEQVNSDTWDDAIEIVKSKKADMFSGVGETNERKEYMNFTSEHLFSTPYVFVSRKNEDFKYGFDNIEHKKIATNFNSTIYGILKEHGEDEQLIVINSQENGFDKVRDNEVDAFITNAATAKYYINVLGYKDLKISYKSKYNLDLKIAVRKELPKEVMSIINKTVHEISKKEISDIVYKWTEGKKVVTWRDYWVEILEAVVVIVLILIFILWNNRKLKSMVDIKTVQLRELLGSLETKVEARTQDLNIAKKEVEAIHKHTRESIEYASLIQGALIPEDNVLDDYFKDKFVHWMPKDTVGGDIWLFDKLRHDDECLLLFIDCTGHGVPGAFVTMIVKAVEREVISLIMKDKEMDVSPAWVMGYFNKTMKQLLKQTTKDSKSNAGFDGGIIYYNKKSQILKFAGAETPLFYIDENKELQTVKGNRYSVGYKKCEMDYKYKETVLHVKEGMKFYCTTDGYLDQNGGKKSFPFGKKRFGNIIKAEHTKPMNEQKLLFLEEMRLHEEAIVDNDRNDDMTLIAFEIGKQSTSPELILEYDGVLTQGIIAHSMDIIEHSIESMSKMGSVSTVVVELTQNMMNYSKSHDMTCRDIRPAGCIEVLHVDHTQYFIKTKNVISIEDKQRVEPKLKEVQSLDKDGLKKRYRELRKSGKNGHDKGAGIGFFEIARKCSNIEYEFERINDEKFYFTFKATI